MDSPGLTVNLWPGATNTKSAQHLKTALVNVSGIQMWCSVDYTVVQKYCSTDGIRKDPRGFVAGGV